MVHIFVVRLGDTSSIRASGVEASDPVRHDVVERLRGRLNAVRRLEQVLANDGHLAELSRQARERMAEPSRG